MQRWRQGWLLVGVMMIAANLRPAITSVSPVLARIGVGLGLGAFSLAVLATIPVVCFAALAPVSLPMQGRFGMERTVMGVLGVLCIGQLLRLIDDRGALFAGTFLTCAAIAVANVLVPAIVKRDFPARVGLVTGLYVTMLYVAAALGAGISVPLARTSQLGWRAAIGFWALPAAAAALVWLPQLWSGAGRPALVYRRGGFQRLMRSRLAWAVTLYMGLQSLGYYGVLSWLPSIMHAVGVSPARAGLMLSVSTVVALPATLLTPSLAVRWNDQRGLMIAIMSITAVGYLGLTVAPGAAPWLWIVIIGVGQGAMFPLALTLIVLRAGGAAEAMALSAFAQTIGYAVSIAGPLGMGALHAATGLWWPAMAFLLVVLVPTLAAGLSAARPETIRFK